MQKQILGFEFEFCRGIQGGCKNALFSSSNFINELIKISENSYWAKKFSVNLRQYKKHELLKIGVCACPNGCAKPQIKDIGFLARADVKFDPSRCQECGLCIKICKEGAIAFEDKMVFKKDKCLGCGDCLDNCPFNALYTSKIYFEVMLGGRLGRHPKLAEPILSLSPDECLAFFKFFLSLFEKYPNIIQAKDIFNYLNPKHIKDLYTIIFLGLARI